MTFARYGLVALFIATAPTYSWAYCSRGISFDFESSINSEFKYLLCLHNEQVNSLNSQAEFMNTSRRMIGDLASDLDGLREKHNTLVTIISEQERVIESLKWEIELLERRLGAIED